MAFWAQRVYHVHLLVPDVRQSWISCQSLLAICALPGEKRAGGDIDVLSFVHTLTPWRAMPIFSSFSKEPITLPLI